VPADIWSLVLAGGGGRRLNPVTGGVPKQYFSLGAGPTLLERTVERLDPLSPRSRRVTVVADWHRPFLVGFPNRQVLGDIVHQPLDRGTAVGVLLGVTEILARDPAAIVIVTPSDHGVTRPALFRYSVGAAVTRVRAGHDFVVFGVEPTTAAVDFGWITPAPQLDREWCAIGGFYEKPDAASAERLFRDGAVWNTMVIVAQAAAIFAECARSLPDITRVFRTALRMDPAGRTDYLARVYPALPNADFSRDVLANTVGLTLHRWPAELGWSDLGTPERFNAFVRQSA
jgi:mannose-1-phosphate guanylyltransferase